MPAKFKEIAFGSCGDYLWRLREIIWRNIMSTMDIWNNLYFIYGVSWDYRGTIVGVSWGYRGGMVGVSTGEPRGDMESR